MQGICSSATKPTSQSVSDQEISRRLLKVYEIFDMFEHEDKPPRNVQNMSTNADNDRATGELVQQAQCANGDA
jgi:hypothetical protein